MFVQAFYCEFPERTALNRRGRGKNYSIPKWRLLINYMNPESSVELSGFMS